MKTQIKGQMSIFNFPEILPEEKHSVWNFREDLGRLMLECDTCMCRVNAVNFAKAVGTHGFRFCPYCGARIMNSQKFEKDSEAMKWPMTLSDKFQTMEDKLQ